MSGTDDPPPPDPWLREALRHAPDAAAGPPAKLDDHILRMGRAAVAPRPAPTPPAPPSLGERLMAAWDWLARPPVAAGFASLLVATVVGVMWWGRPLQDSLPPREEAAAPAAATAPEATAPAPVAVPAPEPRRTPAAPPVATAPAPAPAARSADAPKAAHEPTELARKSAAPEPARPAAPAAEATAPAAARDAAPAPAREKSDELPPPAARNLALPGAPAVPPPASAAPPAGAAAPGTLGALGALRARAAVGTIETASFSNLRFEIKPRAQAWTWQRDDGPARPMDDAMQNWIGLADRTARPHWNPGTAAGEGATTTLRFLRDGQLKATVRIGPRGLRIDRGGSSESAELAASQTATITSALDALGP